MNLKRKLKQYNLEARHSDDPNGAVIDEIVYDDQDNVAWIWGDNPQDAEYECNHPDQCIDWGDDDECGECELCGATCFWNYSVSADDGYVIKERVPYEWDHPKEVGGVIGKYLADLQEKW